ncbi:hypothetical protein DXG01_003290, partial [Tephrocybe rancida]
MRYSFYPGVPPPNYSYAPSPDSSKRLFDGHLGRFDYSVFPQVLQKNYVWRALIYRPRAGQSRGLAEFELLYEHWVSMEAPAFTNREGYLSPAYLNILGARVSEIKRHVEQRRHFMENNYNYLWSTRPKSFLLAELKQLRRVTLYEDAIDQGATLQRGIREMDAWIRLADALGSQSWKSRVDKMRLRTIDPADDELLGCWINGCLEDNTLLLLSLDAPCYIIHEMTGDGAPGTEMHEVQHSPNLGWFDGTDLEGMEPEKLAYEYDKIALRNGSRREVHYSRLPRTLARGSLSERQRSSALSQGWRGPRVGKHLQPPPPPPLVPHEPNPKEEIHIDPAADAHYQAKPLERVRVFADRVEWIKPPPVLSVAGLQGEWTKWEQQMDGSFIRQGKRWQVEDDDVVVCYDREKRRELVMNDDERPAKGVVSDIAAFGMPAPIACYWKTAEKTWRDINSRWMYRSRHPAKREWTGMTAPTPKESDLPLDLDLAAEALLNEIQFQPMDVDVDGRISLCSDDGDLEDEVIHAAKGDLDSMDLDLSLTLNNAAEPVSKAPSDAAGVEPKIQPVDVDEDNRISLSSDDGHLEDEFIPAAKGDSDVMDLDLSLAMNNAGKPVSEAPSDTAGVEPKIQPVDVDEDDRISLGSDDGHLEDEVIPAAKGDSDAMDLELPLALNNAAEPGSRAPSDTARVGPKIQPVDVDEDDRISLGSDGGHLEDEVIPAVKGDSDAMDLELLLALNNAARVEPKMVTIRGGPSCHLCREAPTIPRSNEEILQAVRIAGENDLALFISCVIVSVDGQIWVSTTTSEGAQSFLNSGALGGLWDYATNEEMDWAGRNASWKWESPREPSPPPLPRATTILRRPPSPLIERSLGRRESSPLVKRKRSLSLDRALRCGSRRFDSRRRSRSPSPGPSRHTDEHRYRSPERQCWARGSAFQRDRGYERRYRERSPPTPVWDSCRPRPGTSSPRSGRFASRSPSLPRCSPSPKPSSSRRSPLPSLGRYHLEHKNAIATAKKSSAEPSVPEDESITLDDKEQEIVLLYAKALKETIAAHRAGAELSTIPKMPNLSDVQVRRPLEERMDLDRSTLFERMGEPASRDAPPQVMKRFVVQFEERVAEPGIAPPKKKRHRSRQKERAKLDRIRAHEERRAAEAS